MKKPRRWWMVRKEEMFGYVFSTKEKADECAGTWHLPVKSYPVVEITPEVRAALKEKGLI